VSGAGDGSLRADGLGFSFGRQAVLRGVDLRVRRGETVGLVGPNGSGKTTLVRLLSGVLRPQAGRVLLAGRDLRSLSRRERAQRIAVLPQSFELPESFTAHEVVMMGRNPHVALLRGESAADLAVVAAAMERTGTLQFSDRPATELSGGERQRLLLARALAQEPDYLLLDEATSNLDLHFQVEFLRLVRAQRDAGTGALLVLHDLNLAARSCDRLVLLTGGSVRKAGTPAEVLREDVLQEVYGSSVRVLTVPGSDLPVVLPSV
jgi:iron complex transport system ATP-binding protein